MPQCSFIRISEKSEIVLPQWAWRELGRRPKFWPEGEACRKWRSKLRVSGDVQTLADCLSICFFYVFISFLNLHIHSCCPDIMREFSDYVKFAWNICFPLPFKCSWFLKCNKWEVNCLLTYFTSDNYLCFLESYLYLIFLIFSLVCSHPQEKSSDI